MYPDLAANTSSAEGTSTNFSNYFMYLMVLKWRSTSDTSMNGHQVKDTFTWPSVNPSFQLMAT